MRLSPHDPLTFVVQAATAAAQFFAGRHAEAFSWAELSIREQPDYTFSTSVAAASAAVIGNHLAAAKAMARLRQLMPGLRLSNITNLFPIRRAEDFEHWAESLRKAGLPE